MKKYIIKLSNTERLQLKNLIKKGHHQSRVITRARILISINNGNTDSIIAKQENVTERTIRRIRQRYKEGGLDRALYDAPRSGTPPAMNEFQETYLVATACSNPPLGRNYWTMELIRKKLIKDKIIDNVSVGTVHARLTERGIKPWREKNVVYSQS